MQRVLSGTRIRQRRHEAGLKQAVLAQRAGISASYLNLIEHNRRSASPKILESIANVLNISPTQLSDDADAPLKAELRSAARENPNQPAELEKIEELTVLFPGWAKLISTQARQMRDQASSISALNDRYNFDPRLQSSLHEMLTTVAAIRSSASILTGEDTITPDETDRFQSNIHETSIRLSDAVSGLVTYFEAAHTETQSAATPQEENELFLESHDHVFPALEVPGKDHVKTIERIIRDAPMLTAPESQTRARIRLAQFAADADALPFEPFLKAAQAASFAPDVLAREFSTDVHTVFRRLAALHREGVDAPSFGLVIINAAGLPIYRRPHKEFSLPRFVSICAFWPVFAALSAPGQAMEDILVLPDGQEFLARTLAQPLENPQFGQRPTFASAMIVIGINEAFKYGMLDRAPQAKIPIGSSCRLCERANCVARAEPAIAHQT